MLHSPSLLVLDAAAAVIMLVLASLSKGLGEALKIRPYYRLLYVSAGLVMASSLTSAIFFELSVINNLELHFIVPAVSRVIAGIIAVGAGLRYWQWLFKESINK